MLKKKLVVREDLRKIKKINSFIYRKGSEKKKQLTDYYFWNLDSLETKMSYICENRQIDIGCVHNEGIDYRYYTIFNIHSVIKVE